MARKSGISANRQAPPVAINGQANGPPPPSTIAAQIVHNASNIHGRQDPKTKISFAELVKEFLQNPSTDEPDSQLIALVCVIAEAGLDGLFKDNPFASDTLKQQGIDSIAALRLILQQKPHLLLSAKDDESAGVPRPPLLIWLYPKMVGLLNQKHLLPVHSHVQDFLSICLSTLSLAPTFWRHAASLLRLYKSCVQSILTELEPTDGILPSSTSPFNLVLPSSSSINEFWHDSQQFVALPQDLSRTITSRTQAIYLGLHILSSILNAINRTRRKCNGSNAIEQTLLWGLDSCLALWDHFQRWGVGADIQALQDEIVAMYLQIFETAAFTTITGDCVSSSPKAVLSLASSLSNLIQDLSSLQLSHHNQLQLARILTRLRGELTGKSIWCSKHGRRQGSLKSSIEDQLGPAISETCQKTVLFVSLDKDLQLAFCLWTSPGPWPPEITELREELCSDASNSFLDTQLLQESMLVVKSFRQLNLVKEERPAKRQKTLSKASDEEDGAVYSQLIMALNGSSQESPVPNLSQLYNVVQARYSTMSDDVQKLEDEQSELISAFAKVACAGSRCLKSTGKMPHHWKTFVCTVCDASQASRQQAKAYWNNNDLGEDWKDAIAAMLSITREEKFQKSSKPRVLMALAIGRLFNHISDPYYLNLDMCELGQWLLASISRSLRELKIAAVRSLMVFLRDDISRNIRQKNRRSTVEFLNALSKREILSDQEALIIAYGQIARVCGELELPIILHQLVEYLGHTNPLICGMAYNELDSIAEDFGVTPMELLRPYWKVIGFSVIKDILNKPQKAQQLADFTEQSVRQLLVLTHSDTLPHVVLTKRKDILERIASARGTEIEDLFLQPRKNLAKVLALLLCQPVADVEAYTMDILVAMAPAVLKLREIGGKLENLVKMDPDKIAVEILVLAADHEETKRKPFRRGFHTLAVLSELQHGHRKPNSKAKSLDLFFEAHILGMIAHFSDIIESPLMQNQIEPYPLPERRRCVAAIEELITLARNNVSYALPQVRACLQSAMADPNLCDQTFFVWSALLMVLDEEDLEVIVDQTFALIVQHWPSFSEETQLKANETVLYLTQKHNALLLQRIDYIPSLASIPMMSKTEGELVRLKAKEDPIKLFHTFSQRCKDQNAVVVRQALKELVPFLEANQKYLHQSLISQKPLPVLAVLCRSLLDACVRFAEGGPDIPVLCAQCLGLIGGLDPYRVETVREKKYVLMLSNFNRKDEVIDFIALLLERILVKVFLSTNNAKAQGWIAYVMQEMLKACEFSAPTVQRPRSSQASPESQRWYEIPEAVRNTLIPFLSSRYSVTKVRDVNYTPPAYPIFNSQISHTTWLQTFVYDLLQKGKGVNVEIIFPVLSRVIRGYDLSIATFILPFAALNVIITGDDDHMLNVGRELLEVLEVEIQSPDQPDAAAIKQCSENVFQTLDYLSLWLQEKRKEFSDAMVMAGKTGRGITEDEVNQIVKQISCVENILQMIPAEVISKRAVECGSYARALFHWEQYFRQEQAKPGQEADFEKDEMLQHLQVIYAQIDEPDSLEGISAHLQVLNPEQQIMEHRKAGRWTAAQSWYEIELAEKPNDSEAQANFLTCLRESGQHDSILNYVDGFNASNSLTSNTLPFAVEAAWSVGKWDQLEKILTFPSEQQTGGFIDFNVGVGRALLEMRRENRTDFDKIIQTLRETLAKGLSPSTTDSLQASHDYLVKLHALYELEAVSGMTTLVTPDREVILEDLERRLDILGAYTSDKQYLLGIRRAAMQLSRIDFTNLDIASAWLTTARLARKGEFMTTAFNSVLHATKLGDDASKIEYSKLLWKEGHHRKAIQNLQGAISRNAFQSSETVAIDLSVTTTGAAKEQNNKVRCHAQLLLAKWLDQAGQTKHNTLKDAYATAVMSFPRWDKGHYYLGRYYLKLHESEKKLPVAKQSSTFLAGDTAKLVIENFVRSTVYGTKYYYQTLPKILTLWLDMGMDVMQNVPRAARDKELHEHKAHYLKHINQYLERYSTTRMPAFAWFTAFPQIITRISHPNKSVWNVLQTIIIQVASAYPQQALWSLLAVVHSTQDDRRTRGTAVLQKLRETSKRKGSTTDLKSLIIHGQRLTDALLSACDAPVEPRVSHVSLSRDLGFSLKLAPCSLVVPIEATMNPNLPATNDSRAIRAHNPFPQDAVITISAFMDDVLVLSSLQRPRKVNVRGSDGRSYGLLCKPKDDLRKDQRLMEFNAMINRALQHDVEASKRRLYIKTYGVTPLNEECGTIEWVEGLKPMRDIIIRLYRQKNVVIDYTEIRMLLNEACSSPSKTPIFTDKILRKFPPVLYEWFVESFPEPEAWFAARLRYTRSCAVMSIVGHVLGLGDRHGENVLLEEGNGGTFHVDFNCLFDKGLTFEKPELVPFRLTHNMVDAMGPQGIEGPFRKSCELTYSLLRQHEDTLITILETFVHDPTADFLGGKRRKKIVGVPDTPQEVLDSVRTKVAGYMKGESVPLSVEGYVDALCQMAKDPVNLAAMYIGWCAFF